MGSPTPLACFNLSSVICHFPLAMDHELGTLQREALAEIANAQNVIELDQVRVKYLGRSGLISKLSESMRSLPKEDRPRVGKLSGELHLTRFAWAPSSHWLVLICHLSFVIFLRLWTTSWAPCRAMH